MHYSSVLCNPQLKNRRNYDEKKEWQLYAFLLEFLAVRSLDRCALSVNVSRYHCYVN
jgi:hypothetical protein